MPVSGVYGGISGDGTITAALFHEHSIPNRQTIKVTEEGQRQATSVSEADVTRVVQVVAQFSPRQAISVGKWLIEKGILSMEENPRPELKELLEDIGFRIKDSES
jgi:molybdate-binding protein